MAKGLIDRLRVIGQKLAPDTTREETAKEIERLQADLVQTAAEADKARQMYEDAMRENVELRQRVKLLETTLESIANTAHKALEVV
jgi:hypothetical protein